jgi:hypothetical protein
MDLGAGGAPRKAKAGVRKARPEKADDLEEPELKIVAILPGRAKSARAQVRLVMDLVIANATFVELLERLGLLIDKGIGRQDASVDEIG